MKRRVKPRKVLPFMLAVFFVVPLTAQQRLPASTETFRATLAGLKGMTQSNLSELLANAQSGDREAQYSLALVFEQGQLVPRDLASARNWMLKSAEQGYVPAQVGMGLVQSDAREAGSTGRDYGDAERWLRLAATQGDADGQLWLGLGYERGRFGVTDYQEALKWLRKAVDQGQPNAQLCLGQMYEYGEGVPKSDLVAARLHKKAADHFSDVPGVWEAEVELAYMSRDGRLPDNVEAYMWLAIVGSSVVPPISDEIKQMARHLSKPQIAEAQRKAADWIKAHTPRSEEVAKFEK